MSRNRTAHKDLKPGMEVLTDKGWATVHALPIPTNQNFLVRLTNGRSEIREPDYLWVRRVNQPFPAKETQ